jgi:hypothetical protein
VCQRGLFVYVLCRYPTFTPVSQVSMAATLAVCVVWRLGLLCLLSRAVAHAMQLLNVSRYRTRVLTDVCVLWSCSNPPVQAVARRVAYQTFSHVLDLDVTFHMNRRTGRLSRILERGKCAGHVVRTLLRVCACT